MCCIGSSNDGKNHHCCCCIPIFIGVILLAVLNVLDLMTAISMHDWISTTIYSILTIFFAIALFQKDGPWRSHLFHSYLVGFILTLIYVIYFCFFSGKVQDSGNDICRVVEKAISWDNCESTVDGYIWWFVGIYLVLLILVRLFFVRLLHAFKEQGEKRANEYKELHGHNHNSSVNHDHHDDHGHGNHMH